MNPSSLELKRKVQRLQSLPTLPGIVQKISQLVDNPNVSTAKIGEEISKDQVLSAKVLKLVNSSFYGLSGRISSINQALVLLGFNVVKGLVLSTSVFEKLTREMIGFYEHSLGCAIAAGIIAKEIGHPDKDEIWIAGLLHDIGKVIMWVNLPDDFAEIVDEAKRTRQFITDVEKEHLSITHTDVADWLATKWHLPISVREPMIYHHSPSRAKTAKVQTAIVHLANILVNAYGFGQSGDDLVPPLDDQSAKLLGLTDRLLDEIILRLDEELSVTNTEDYLG